MRAARRHRRRYCSDLLPSEHPPQRPLPLPLPLPLLLSHWR
jgi:hypothetical protein